VLYKANPSPPSPSVINLVKPVAFCRNSFYLADYQKVQNCIYFQKSDIEQNNHEEKLKNDMKENSGGWIMKRNIQ
jgi:hypothetical protein